MAWKNYFRGPEVKIYQFLCVGPFFTILAKIEKFLNPIEPDLFMAITHLVYEGWACEIWTLYPKRIKNEVENRFFSQNYSIFNLFFHFCQFLINYKSGVKNGQIHL